MSKGNKIRFKAVVVDDQNGRNSTYCKILDNYFDVKFVNEYSAFSWDAVSNADIFIMDVSLGMSPRTNAFNLIEEYHIDRKEIPTVLVSDKWVENNEPDRSITRTAKYKNIIYIAKWESPLPDERCTALGEEIYNEFCRYKNMIAERKEDLCTLLQISDLQFGGHIQAGAINDADRIGNFLREQDIVPDLVVIAGDIAQKGHATEYRDAAKWIKALADSIWGDCDKEPGGYNNKIIIVPGNHDYDISVSASDLFSFQFGSEEIDKYEKKEGNIDFRNQKLGFNYFSRFAADLFGDDSLLKYADEALHYNNRFINWGINFVLMNSAYRINSRNCENRNNQFYCDFSSLSETDLPLDKSKSFSIEGMFNILITHNSPHDFNPNTERGHESWQKIQSIIQDNRINLWLHGHTHDQELPNILRDNGGDYCANCIVVQSPTLRLEAGARTGDARRGFNIIELHKTEDVVRKVKVRRFETENATIRELEYRKEIQEFKVTPRQEP